MRGGRVYNTSRGSIRGGGGSYRSSGSSYNNRMQSSRRPGGFHDHNYGSNSSRYNNYSGSSSYDSRNRDKFTPRYNGNRSDGSHKRTYRATSRDRSDDRKRLRQDEYRRTSSSGRGNRTSPPSTSQTSSSNYHRGPNINSSTSYRSSNRVDRDGSHGRHRSSNHNDSSMGPPKRTIRSGYISRPRGSMTTSGRGMRSSIRGGGVRIIRKESADLRIMRRKLIYAQQKDRARVIKIARLTSSLRRRRIRSKSPSSRRSRSAKRGNSSGDDEDAADDDEEKSDSEMKKKISSKHGGGGSSSGGGGGGSSSGGGSGKHGKSSDKDNDDNDDDVEKSANDDDDDDEAENNKNELKSKKGEESLIETEVKIEDHRERSSKADEDDEEEEEEEGDEDDKDENGKDIKKEGKKRDKANTSNDTDEIRERKEKAKSAIKTKKDDKDEKGSKKKTGDDDSIKKEKKERREHSSRRSGEHGTTSNIRKGTSRFIKLTCIHCHLKCITFKEYQNHLYSRTHRAALRQVSIRQKAHLSRLRLRQRNVQREIEEKSKDDCESKFCQICRLHYRQPKAKHQLSEHHKTIKKFLMPYCSTCHLAFKSPMLYETHRCSLDHIRNKARNNDDDESDVSVGDDMREIDLNKFMTVDSIGEIDDIDADEEYVFENSDQLNDIRDDDPMGVDRVPVGANFVKRVDAYYCEICRTYSTISDSDDNFIKKHCMSRNHLKAFIRYKEEEKSSCQKDDKSDGECDDADKKKVKDESANEMQDIDDDAASPQRSQNRNWESVDKDLGDLLREVEAADNDDEEEDESVLNIDIESEKPKLKELNGKKEDMDMNISDDVNCMSSAKAKQVKVHIKPKEDIYNKSTNGGDKEKVIKEEK